MVPGLPSRLSLSTTLTPALLHSTQEFVDALNAMDMKTVQDLLLYFPRAHEDLSAMATIETAPVGEKVTIRGVLTGIKLVRTRSRKQIVQAKFADENGDAADVIWFNQPHIKRMVTDGDEVVLTGKLTINGRKLVFQSPVFEKQTSKPLVHSGRLVPVYPQHDRITTRWLREKMPYLKGAVKEIEETLPEDVIAEEKLLTKAETIAALHFPESPEQLNRAMERLSFEKMFELQREALTRKRTWQQSAQSRLKTPMDVELIKALFKSLKFTPTEGQRIAIYEILRDMEKDVPMSRLLEGDVGSGKTLVAVAVMSNVLRAGAQCALMVPTEVLARQHAASISRMLINFHAYVQKEGPDELKTIPLPTIGLLTGALPKAEADDIRKRAAAGTIDILVGTHSLIEDTVKFRDLRLVIVDEQHRFGVMQRQKLRDKGSPHFLSMTATPIPRTLALTAYGDHDLSVLLEKPGKRKPIHTKVVSPDDRIVVERFIDVEIEAGRQAFVICPLIQESTELAEVKNVENEAARLRKEFPKRTVALLHGKLAPEEKQRIMQEFRDKKSDILVSTSVIEVGIDVPNATIILIEGAERFGLAGLHQLRGRVGRGEHKSHCFLFATTPEQAKSPRLKAMEQHESGFMLAEIDLKIRGPGELFGLRQSGIPDAEMAMLLQPELISRARRAAEKALGITGAETVKFA
jgi:ATP-dependent DNA helicase RecG